METIGELEKYLEENCYSFRELSIGKHHALEDISEVIKYIDYPCTSNDIGYRKPRGEGLQFLAKKMRINIKEMAFVGDEEKDIMCAVNAGAYSVLINRSGNVKNYGQDKEIRTLDELLDVCT